MPRPSDTEVRQPNRAWKTTTARSRATQHDVEAMTAHKHGLTCPKSDTERRPHPSPRLRTPIGERYSRVTKSRRLRRRPGAVWPTRSRHRRSGSTRPPTTTHDRPPDGSRTERRHPPRRLPRIRPPPATPHTGVGNERTAGGSAPSPPAVPPTDSDVHLDACSGLGPRSCVADGGDQSDRRLPDSVVEIEDLLVG